MIDSLEVQEFDRLEDMLLGEGVSFGEMTRQYARYLLSLIEGGVLAAISESKLKMLIPYIEEGILRERIENDVELRKKLAIELWEMERQYRKLDEGFANLIRCVLFCFEIEERWIEEGTGDATPIYLYFLILKKVLPDIRQNFIKSFQVFIAGQRKIN